MYYHETNFLPLDASGTLSWVHFGDLHLTTAAARNYQDLCALIADANRHLTGPGGVNFAFLPGDNADHGTEEEYLFLRQAFDQLRLPLHALPGDHDIQSGSLLLFRYFLEPVLPKSLQAGGYRCVFLNSVDIKGREGFSLGRHQIAYLEGELEAAARAGQKTVLFMHTYPSELGEAAPLVTRLIQRHDGVRLVEMGHTHYNELANDGRTIYAATRSTGQIEEGPVGFSLTCLDGDVVSWKFKPLETPWPFVMITSPADQALLTQALSPVRGVVPVRARAWDGDGDGVRRAECRVDDGAFQPMTRLAGTGTWQWTWDSAPLADGSHRLTVRVENAAGAVAEDVLTVLTDQAGHYAAPSRHPVDNENAIGSYPSKGILGTQLGPNKNGHGWEPS